MLAVLFFPAQTRWQRAVRGRNSLAALLTILTILVIVILPLVLVGIAVSREVVLLYDRVASGEIDLQEPILRAQEYLPLANDLLERLGTDFDQLREGLSNAAVTTSRFLAAQALDIGQNALRFVVLLFLMLYFLFFFLRDGRRILDHIIRALPLGDNREQRLMDKFAEVARATIKGTLVVGVVQGSIGALLFWMLGIGAPVFWGVIMTLLSLLPAVGSAIIWGPAAIYLIATGEVVNGIILIAAGTLIIGLVDNILRPILVGRDTKMPDFLILLATLGGLTVFGISGFVIGPIIAGLFLIIWQMFEFEFSSLDDPPPLPAEPPAGPPPPHSAEPSPPRGTWTSL